MKIVNYNKDILHLIYKIYKYQKDFHSIVIY